MFLLHGKCLCLVLMALLRSIWREVRERAMCEWLLCLICVCVHEECRRIIIKIPSSLKRIPPCLSLPSIFWLFTHVLVSSGVTFTVVIPPQIHNHVMLYRTFTSSFSWVCLAFPHKCPKACLLKLHILHSFPSYGADSSDLDRNLNNISLS